MATDAILEKAVRLLAAGAVEPDPMPVRSYTVRGDHGNYRVVVGAHLAFCSCPADGACSHLESVLMRENANAGELGLIDEALRLRKMADAAEAARLFDRLEA